MSEHGKIIYIHGRIGNYLETANDQPNWNLLEIAGGGLRIPLVSALNKVCKTDVTEITLTGLCVKTNGNFDVINMTICRISDPEPLLELFLVSFKFKHSQKDRILKQIANSLVLILLAINFAKDRIQP